MWALIAHLKLRGRHWRQVWVGPYVWSYCGHLGHESGKPDCWRWLFYDGYCTKHCNSCYGECEKETA